MCLIFSFLLRTLVQIHPLGAAGDTGRCLLPNQRVRNGEKFGLVLGCVCVCVCVWKGQAVRGTVTAVTAVTAAGAQTRGKEGREMSWEGRQAAGGQGPIRRRGGQGT